MVRGIVMCKQEGENETTVIKDCARRMRGKRRERTGFQSTVWLSMKERVS